MSTHEHYEELCTLAVSGQASPEELTDLRSHLEACPECRAVAYDFTQISAQGLAQVAAKRLNSPIPSGMTGRFVARARSEGIQMSREDSPVSFKPRRRVLLAGACATAVVLLGGSISVIYRNRFSPHATAGSELVQRTSKLPPAQTPVAISAEALQSQRELAAARSEIGTLSSTMETQRRELESLTTTRESLLAEIAKAEQESARRQAEKADLETRISALEAEIAKAKSDKSASDTAIIVQEAELRELRKKVVDQEAALSQQAALGQGGNDVRDLVVARNLHIIDVHDRDGDGKSQRAFGRIFYTERKSLIFYAYDLADPRKLDAKVSFYVWGERLGSEKPIRSLGVLHSDDAEDGRWALTFDDPNVLAQINSVFVTVESARKQVKEPGGRKILFAFLGEKPNHP